MRSKWRRLGASLKPRAHLRRAPEHESAGGAGAGDAAAVGAEAAAGHGARVPQPRVRVHALLVPPQLRHTRRSRSHYAHNSPLRRVIELTSSRNLIAAQWTRYLKNVTSLTYVHFFRFFFHS